MKREAIKDGAARSVGKAPVVEGDTSGDRLQKDHAAGIFIFLRLRQDLAGALEARECFGDLRADGGDLENRRDEESQECGVGKILSERHGAGEYLPRSEIHDDAADDTYQYAGRQSEYRRGGQSLEYVVEQALHPAGEDRLFPAFGVITLHHAHAAERFGQTAGDLSVNLAALAENRTDGTAGFAGGESENNQESEGEQRHRPADVKQPNERQSCR